MENNFRVILRWNVYVLVVARVKRIATTLIGTELEREQSVLAPRNVGVHVDLVLRLGQVRESFAADGPKVDLRNYKMYFN